MGGCPLAGSVAIEVVPSATNDLACTLSWSTDQPARPRVEFGEGEEPAWWVAGVGPATDHEVLVIGMRPRRTYRLWAVTVDDGGTESRAGPVQFTTGPTPFPDLVTEVTAHDVDRRQPGWTLANVAVGSANYPATAVMFDADGYPVWYHTLGETGAHAMVDVEVSWVDGQHVLLGGSLAAGTSPTEVDLAGRVVWEGPVQPPGDGLLTPGQMHHSFTRVADGDSLALRYDGKDGDLFDVIEMLSPGGDVAWSWSGEQHLPDDVTTYPWGNAVLADPAGDAFYYNARLADRLFKLDGHDGRVVWSLGEAGDFAPDADAADPWFAEAHAPELQPDGHILLYDNGGAARGYSRVVEYELDEGAMGSRIVWEYPGKLAADPWYCAAMGDADRLANGNTLVTAGSLFSDNSRSRIFEVTAAGDVVWEMWITAGEDELAAPYMAERIPALAEAI